MKYLLVIIISGLILSCTKEVEINIPHEKSKIVAYSTIVPFTLSAPKPLGIKVQSSLHIFDNAPNTINDAIVLYFENNVLKDTLKYVASLDEYSISNSMSDYPIYGNRYSIQIQADGYETISATTKIPSKVTITDTTIVPIAYIDETGSVSSEISLTFKDPADEINFYEIVLSDIAFNYDSTKYFYKLSTNDYLITNESYYPSLVRFDVHKPKFLLFSDKSINGEEYTLRFYYTPPQTENDHRFISNHYVSLHLRNVSEAYYKFKTSMLQQLYNNEEDFLYGMGEPINVISNIQNSYGLFAGFNNDIVSIHIPEQIINK